MTSFELVEHEPKYFARDDFSPAVAAALARIPNVVEVEYPSPRTNERWRLTAQSFAGVLPLDDVQLILKPKVPVRDLLRLWERAHGLPITFGENAQSQTIPEVCDGLAHRFALACLKRAHDGWPQRSQICAERLPVVRGRINLQALTRDGNESRLMCAWSERTPDTLLARACKWALHLALRGDWTTGETRRQTRRALQTLDQVALTSPHADGVAALERDLVPHDRELFALCSWVLNGTSFAPRAATAPALGFLIPMERLFERAVTRWLQLHASREWSLQVQPRVSLPPLGAVETSRAPFFRPDLVLCARASGRPRCAIDAKYVSDERPSSREIAQVVAYATALGCRDALLIYPHTLPSHVRAGTVRVRNAAFPLDADWDDCGEEVLSALRASE